MFLLGLAGLAAAQPATVLLNGKIVTMDARSSIGEAVAAREGRIVAVGASADLRKLGGNRRG